MKERLQTAEKVWQRYLDGDSKSGIAKALGIPRAEVQGIIKYTTSSMYLKNEDLEARFKKEKEKLITDARKIISQKNTKIKALEKELQKAQDTKLSIFGKKLV